MYSIATIEFSSCAIHYDEEPINGWEKVLIGKRKKGKAYFYKPEKHPEYVDGKNWPEICDYPPVNGNVLSHEGEYRPVSEIVQWVHKFGGYIMIAIDHELESEYFDRKAA